MDIANFKVSGAGDGSRQGQTYSYYGIVLEGAKQSTWVEVGTAWTSGAGYIEKIGNGSDYGYASIAVPKDNFDAYFQMSISDLGSDNSYILLNDQTTGENFLPWFNADVTGTAHLGSISTATWTGLAYTPTAGVISDGVAFWTVCGRRGSVLYWYVIGDANVAIVRSGMGVNDLAVGIIPDTKTVRLYNFVLGF